MIRTVEGDPRINWVRPVGNATDWSLDGLSAGRSTSISVVLPALNEQATVGRIVAEIRRNLMGSRPLVDELVVLDSGSTDATAEIARTAGARVLHRDQVLERIPAVVGKGEAMWRAVAATTGDLVVFIDADLESFTAQHIVGLVGPLLTDDSVDFVKAAYHRPIQTLGELTVGGGRVTELVARPLLNLYWPALADIIQPLAGEYAIRRPLLEVLPFPCGYGVDFGLLVDAADQRGSMAIAQVDLGTRIHRHQDDLRLGRMSTEIIRVAMARLRAERLLPPDQLVGTSLTQFHRSADGYSAEIHEVAGLERPPLHEIPEYVAGRATALAR